MSEGSNMPPAASDEVSFGRRLTEIAAERADDIDLIIVARDGTETGISWGELESRANQIARALESRGVRQDDIVTLAAVTGIQADSALR